MLGFDAMTQKAIYFDFNATTPVDPQVLFKLPEWLTLWGNPSSIHFHGRGAKKLLRESRRSMAQALDVHPLELIFTSGGSESNNLAIKGSLQEIKKKNPGKNTVIIGSIEHPSVLKQISQIKEMGFEVKKVPVSPSGEYDLSKYDEWMNESVALVSIMLANNEIGMIAPIREMCEKAHGVGAVFHSDMVQCLGKISFSLKDLDVDMASFSSHKVYALKGSGALYVKKGTPFSARTLGGSQERGRRAGTENLAAVASFAHMIEQLNPQSFKETLAPMRNQFEDWIIKNIEGVRVLGSSVERLPNTTCFLVDSVNAEMMLMNLDIRGFSVGTGAACSSGNPEPSPVLLALGLTRDEAQSSLRVSLGKDTTQEDVMALAQNLKEVVEHLRQLEESQEVSHV